MERTRSRVVVAGLSVIAVLGLSLGALAIGRSAARAPRDTPPPTVAPPTTPPTAPPTTPPTAPPTAPPTTAPPTTAPPTTAPPPAPVYGDEQRGAWQVTGLDDGAHVNVRSGPGTANAVVAQLAHDAANLKSTGRIARLDGALWRQVEYRAGSTGWVHAAFLETYVPKPVFGAEPKGKWDVTGVAAGEFLNVRSGPGTANKVVYRFAHDTVGIESLGKVATIDGALWRQVQWADVGHLGWVSARFVKPHVPQPAPRSPGIIVMGDWDGNGTRTPALFRDGVWHLRFSNSAGPADLVFEFGEEGHHPVAGDWDGDGIETIGVVRGNTWFLRNSNSAGPAHATFSFGEHGATPVVGDWDGDGVDTAGMSDGTLWQVRSTNAEGGEFVQFSYGDRGDRPVVGDWNGDGVDTVGVVRGSRWLLRDANSPGAADRDFSFGDGSDRPVAGDWDGDGVDTPGVVRGSAVLLRNRAAAGSADVSFSYSPD